ncbi:MAG: hypothetical protein ACYC9H_14420, partial [Sulfuricaulis sp.]
MPRYINNFMVLLLVLLSMAYSATVTADPPQQTISGFSPTSGPVGTVVTINGSGYTATTAAW